MAAVIGMVALARAGARQERRAAFGDLAMETDPARQRTASRITMQSVE